MLNVAVSEDSNEGYRALQTLTMMPCTLAFAAFNEELCWRVHRLITSNARFSRCGSHGITSNVSGSFHNDRASHYTGLRVGTTATTGISHQWYCHQITAS